jgi:hypothetical protein
MVSLDAVLTALLFAVVALPTGWCAHTLQRVTNGILDNARKHEPFTDWDGYLPIQGRWLRYAVGVFTAAGSVFFLGIAFFCGVGALFSLAIALFPN